jgi:hypothetical protein
VLLLLLLLLRLLLLLSHFTTQWHSHWSFLFRPFCLEHLFLLLIQQIVMSVDLKEKEREREREKKKKKKKKKEEKELEKMT